MSALSFRITRNDISPALSKMAAAAKRPEPVLRAMGTTLLSITMGNFKSGNAQYRPKTWPAKRDGNPATLQKSGTLSRAFHLAVTNTHATVSNPMVYAAIHQLGGKITGNPWLRFKIGNRWVTLHEVTIPARPFFPVLNGRLTPLAEERIRAAGQRAIDRMMKRE